MIAQSVVLLVTYGLGAIFARGLHGRMPRLLWIGLLTLEWVVLLWLTPDAAYIVFPLFFLYLHLLGRWWGSLAIVLSTVVAIVALGAHGEWTVGGVVGPLVGAGVALLIGLGYQALAREAQQREALMAELIATRESARGDRARVRGARRTRPAGPGDPRHRRSGSLEHPDAVARRRAGAIPTVRGSSTSVWPGRPPLRTSPRRGASSAS